MLDIRSVMCNSWYKMGGDHDRTELALWECGCYARLLHVGGNVSFSCVSAVR